MKANFGSKGKEITTRQSTELASYDMEDLAGDGAEDVGVGDKPRAALRIGQSSSPQTQKKASEYVPGFEAGMIINTSNMQFFSGDVEDKALMFVISKYRRREIEWRQGRKGFVAEHLVGSEITKTVEVTEITEGGRTKLIRLTQNQIGGERTLLVDTAIFFGLAIVKGLPEPIEVTIDMSSSQWSCAKLLNGHYDGIRLPSLKDPNKIYQPPRYGLMYQLYSNWFEDGKDGWYKWAFKYLGPLHPNPKDPDFVEAHQAIVAQAHAYKQKIETDEVDFDYRQKQD